MQEKIISAREFLTLLKSDSGITSIDVRAPSEYIKGHIPFSRNLPILNDDHRQTIGITYKMLGAEAAVKLGHELVDPLRPELVAQWQKILQQNAQDRRFLYCWRGGMRSEISLQWLEEAGASVRRIQGGYKAVRQELHQALNGPFHFMTVTGLTGSGKSQLLCRFPLTKRIDLEEMAQHRGSAFGAKIGTPQPGQQVFENLLGLELFNSAAMFLVEHEGRNIGKIQLPKIILDKINQAPLVFLEASIEERVQRIFREYVQAPLESQKVISPELLTVLASQLERIQKRLGGKLYLQIKEQMQQAFSLAVKVENHAAWITELLTKYYDRPYQHAIDKMTSPVVFKGKEEDCYQFLKNAMEKKA